MVVVVGVSSYTTVMDLLMVEIIYGIELLTILQIPPTHHGQISAQYGIVVMMDLLQD